MIDAAYHRAYYSKMSTEKKERKVRLQRERRHNNIDVLREYKRSKGCKYCPENDPVCLDFHHLHDKNFEIGDTTRIGYGITRLMKEVEKCDVICANCHRKLHSKSGNKSAQQTADFGSRKPVEQSHLP